MVTKVTHYLNILNNVKALNRVVPSMLSSKYAGALIHYPTVHIHMKLLGSYHKFLVTHGGLDTCHGGRLSDKRQWWMGDRFSTRNPIFFFIFCVDRHWQIILILLYYIFYRYVSFDNDRRNEPIH